MIFNSGIDFMKIEDFIIHTELHASDWEMITKKLIKLWSYKYYHFINSILSITEELALFDVKNILRDIHNQQCYPEGYSSFIISDSSDENEVIELLSKIENFKYDKIKAAQALLIGYRCYNFLSISASNAIGSIVSKP